MRWTKTVSMIEAHAEGEIGRIVTGGIGKLPGANVLETLNWLNKEGQSLRHFLVNEPRGFSQMSTCLLLPPTAPQADAAFVIMQGDKTHAMSGSNTICLTTVLLETGRIPMQEPVTSLTIETASGLVEVDAACQDGKCRSVTMRLSDCYADQLDKKVAVEGYGDVMVDIAFGGIFYALVDVDQVGLKICPEQSRALVAAGSAIHRAVNAQLQIKHPEYEGIEGISYVMFTSFNADGEMQGATIMPPGRVDRSPCGTGNSARLAVMAARGQAKEGDEFIARSIINSRFDVSIAKLKTRDGYPIITPQIKGRGWIHGSLQIGVDPDDPFQTGFTMSDCWGEALDLLD